MLLVIQSGGESKIMASLSIQFEFLVEIVAKNVRHNVYKAKKKKRGDIIKDKRIYRFRYVERERERGEKEKEPVNSHDNK